MSTNTKATLLIILMSAVTYAALAQGGKKPDIDAIVRQFHINYSNNEVEKNGALVDDNIVVHVNGGADNKVNGTTYKGRDEFVNWLKGDKAVFPDGKITDHETIVSGNKAAIRFTLEGTQTGPIPTPNGTIPPSGRRVVIQGTEFFTFNSSGKLIHLETFVNALGLITQVTEK
jgi:predicted ester cyclase